MAQPKAYKVAIAALKRKEALLDGIDDQLLGMDSVMTPRSSTHDFDMLSEKREELETDIRKAHERIELINAWEQLKNGDWSEEVKGLLRDLDVDIASISECGSGDIVPPDMGMPPAAPSPVGLPPTPPPPPAPVAPPVESTPPPPDLSGGATEEPSANLDTEPEGAPEEGNLPAPVASKSSSNNK